MKVDTVLNKETKPNLFISTENTTDRENSSTIGSEVITFGAENLIHPTCIMLFVSVIVSVK